MEQKTATQILFGEPNAIHMQELKAAASSLRKYTTTLDDCLCPARVYKRRDCKHILAARLLVSRMLRCVNCGKVGQRLTPELQCEKECADGVDGDMCCVCGQVVDGYAYDIVDYLLYAHTGICMSKARGRDTERTTMRDVLYGDTDNAAADAALLERFGADNAEYDSAPGNNADFTCKDSDIDDRFVALCGDCGEERSTLALTDGVCTSGCGVARAAPVDAWARLNKAGQTAH